MSKRNARRPAPESPRRVLGYLRVSTDKQADSGLSLEAQRAKVEGYAALYGLELVEVLTDAGESGRTPGAEHPRQRGPVGARGYRGAHVGRHAGEARAGRAHRRAGSLRLPPGR